MNLKTYRGDTMAQALSEVKKDLGKDAVILHTRVHRVGAVMGMGGKQIVEITAADQPPARQVRPRMDSAPDAPEGFAVAQFPTRSGSDFSPVAARPPAAPAGTTPGQIEAKPTPTRKGSSIAVRVDPAAQGAEPEAGEAIRTELASIRRLMTQVLQVTRTPASGQAAAAVLATGGMPDRLVDQFAALSEAGVRPSLIDEVLSTARRELTTPELTDAGVVRRAVERAVAAMVRVVGSVTPGGRQATGRPLTIALVGPTGVGKTTTIAKLAAAYKLRQGKRVGLVTCDTYRIAAVEQLRVYAGIIGLPLKVALEPTELANCCGALSDMDVILIDTAGRGQRDQARLDELAALVGAAKPDETHLVLAAGASEGVMGAAAERFARLKPDRVILSKLDEAVQLGPAFNVVRDVALRVSYVTMGQEVPDHIELASADKLARWMLEGPSAQGWGV